MSMLKTTLLPLLGVSMQTRTEIPCVWLHSMSSASLWNCFAAAAAPPPPSPPLLFLFRLLLLLLLLLDAHFTDAVPFELVCPCACDCASSPTNRTAYETLGNQEERETYDLNRQRGGASGPGAGGAGGGFGFGGSGQQQQQQQYQRAWKPRAYQDVHVEDVFKRFFGGGASGSGGSGGAFYSQTFGQGGGAGGDDDDFEKVFESMFKNFHFDKPNTRSKSKFRSSSSKPRSQHKRAGGTFTAGVFLCGCVRPCSRAAEENKGIHVFLIVFCLSCFVFCRGHKHCPNFAWFDFRCFAAIAR